MWLLTERGGRGFILACLFHSCTDIFFWGGAIVVCGLAAPFAWDERRMAVSALAKAALYWARERVRGHRPLWKQVLSDPAAQNLGR